MADIEVSARDRYHREQQMLLANAYGSTIPDNRVVERDLQRDHRWVPLMMFNCHAVQCIHDEQFFRHYSFDADVALMYAPFCGILLWSQGRIVFKGR